MTESSSDMPERLRPSAVFGLCAALFTVRVLPWMLSDLWHDEVITVADFVFGPEGAGLSRVFRSYPVANNHILFSALGWCWVRVGAAFSSDFGMRVLPFAFSLGTLWVVCIDWRRWLGDGLAMIAGLTFACSPVFGAFAWQFRGYALSMFLGAVAVSAVLELLHGRRRRGTIAGVVAFSLLPLVIPGNILLPAGLLLFVVVRGVRTTGGWRGAVELCWPLACAAGIGSAYYLTIWPQFRKVLGQTTGWNSGFAVAVHLLAALAVHVALYLVIRLVDRSPRPEAPANAPTARDGALLLASLAVTAAPFVFMLARAPYPRAFLVFWPALTVAVLLIGGTPARLTRIRPLLLVGTFLMHGFVWDRATETFAAKRLNEDEYPQDLLVQYYRGSNGLSGLCAWIHEKRGDSPEPFVVTSFHDYPTFRYYWGLRGLNPGHVVRVTDENAASTIGEWGAGPIVVVASGEMQAARMFAALGSPGPFREVVVAGDRTLYQRIGE